MLTAMQSDDNVVITVTITRHYGPLSITLGADVTCEIAHEASYQRAFNEITDTLLAGHKRQADRLKPTDAKRTGPPSSGNHQSKPSPDRGAEPSQTVRKFPAEFVDIEEKSGKRYYKIAGGDFVRYGVRIWPEDEDVMSDFGVEPWRHLPTGRHPLPEGWIALASMAGRKPVKVIGLLPDDVEF